MSRRSWWTPPRSRKSNRRSTSPTDPGHRHLRRSGAAFGDRFADRILAQTQNRELGDTGRLLTDIILKAETRSGDAGEPRLLPEDVRQRAGELEAFPENSTTWPDRSTPSAWSSTAARTLRTDIAMLDDLHDETKDSIVDLDAYIEAGKQFGE